MDQYGIIWWYDMAVEFWCTWDYHGLSGSKLVNSRTADVFGVVRNADDLLLALSPQDESRQAPKTVTTQRPVMKCAPGAVAPLPWQPRHWSSPLCNSMGTETWHDKKSNLFLSHHLL